LAAAECGSRIRSRISPATSVKQATQLANEGKIQRAIEILQDAVKKDAKDSPARIALARILDCDGRPDEAVALWEQGLSNAPDDFSLLMIIGEIRHRQGRDGPLISRRRGMIGAFPGKNGAEEEKYKKARLADAAKAYEQAWRNGLFELLERRLPGDNRGFGMDMDLAGSLDELGDPRAVGPLIDVLKPTDVDAAQAGGPLADRNSLRARAATSLGAFDLPPELP
jgi:tetratricopeptide (TPR) repeat protein